MPENDNKCVYAASKKYSVLYNTLKRRVNGQCDKNSKPGQQSALQPAEDEMFVNHINEMCSKGFPQSVIEIRRKACELAKVSGRKMYFNAETGIASWKWWRDFSRRHNLTLRVPENTANYRAACNNNETFDQFFRKYEALLLSLGIEKEKVDPECLWNMDETGLSIVVKGGKVVAKVGSKLVFS